MCSEQCPKRMYEDVYIPVALARALRAARGKCGREFCEHAVEQARLRDLARRQREARAADQRAKVNA